MLITKVTKRVVSCEDCEGTGEVLDWFDSLLGHSESYLCTCGNCKGIGVITLLYSTCSCGRSEWMHPDYSTCSKCREDAIQQLVKVFLPDN